MGRSSPKWIRILMRMSKPSKSHLSKGVVVQKTNVGNKEEVVGVPDEPPLDSTTDGRWDDTSGGIQFNGEIPHDQFNARIYLGETYSVQEQHFASKIQAAYRGYLARRAFRALKGIIRLQAVARGYLVRRQAVSSFHCLRRIVKLQALVCARRLGKVNNKLYIPLTYVTIVVISSVSKPLRLQYDRSDPNSVWSWLERWSHSHFWKPPPMPTTPRLPNSSPQAEPPILFMNHSNPKPASRKSSSPNSPSSELEKPKTNQNKTSSARIEPSKESPHSELERVKRSLRKVSLPMDSPSMPAVGVADLDVNHSLIKIPVQAVPAVTESGVGVLEGGVPKKDGETCGESEEVVKKPQSGKRRASFPMKKGVPGSPEKSRRVPSYMAATKSTKAKLRGQGPTVLVGACDDVPEDRFVRRHSLPSSTLGIVRLSGKGGLKPDRTLSISRDDKGRGEWRR